MCLRNHHEAKEDALSISYLTYSEPGSPFPDCRGGLTDRLSNSVLLPGIDPRTGRKRDAAITTELLSDPAIVWGASPGLPYKPVAKAIMLTSWQQHMDSVAEQSKAVAQGANP